LELYEGRGDAVFLDMPEGSYTVTWEYSSGWRVPEPNPDTRSLEPQGALTFNGQYRVYYADYAYPDSVQWNFSRAWNRMDYQEYSAQLLYDGSEPAADGLDYAAFAFTYPTDPDWPGNSLPNPLPLADELRIAGAIFSGEAQPGGIPGVEYFLYSMWPGGNWESLPYPGEVDGDPYPDGTLQKPCAGLAQVYFSGDLPGTEIDHVLLDGHFELYLIPIIIGAGTPAERSEYRIWKWREVFLKDARLTVMTWAELKAMYY
jgi:hypothetical protein